MPPPINLLVAGPERIGIVADTYPDRLRRALAARGIGVGEAYVLHRDSFADVDLAAVAPLTTDLLIFNCQLPEAAWENLASLQRVVKVGRLRPGINVELLLARDVSYTQVEDAAYVSVAEHALLLMLACARRLTDSLLVPGSAPGEGWPDRILTSQNIRRTNWLELDGSTFRLLWHSRVGIIGLGEIGLEIASRAAALGMEVVYYNRRRLDDSTEQALGVTYVSKEQLLATSSFVVVACTISPGAPPVIARTDVLGMNDHTIIINISRGPAVDEEVLVGRARSSRLGGLGLDVYRVEPIDPRDFDGCSNTYLTAHVASMIPPTLRFEEFADALLRQLSA